MEHGSLNGWQSFFNQEFEKEYMQKLMSFLEHEYSTTKVFPKHLDIFRAFEITHLDKVKVVILGQDPYHGENQAHGLSFSVPSGTPLPPSLKNILAEIRQDVGIDNNNKYFGDLSSWARQGVLLLNTTLTVRAGKPQSHCGKGWELFTDRVIELCDAQPRRLIFLLWGAHAKRKRSLIDGKKHYILEAAHPSPFSAHNGFFGCKHFSKTNLILRSMGQTPIDWRLK